MRILSLQLENFRNYEAQTIELTKDDIQLFIGLNGSGKTNLLEAVSVLSLTRSCRDKDDQDMTMWQKGHYRIKARVKSDTGEESVIEAVTQLEPRKKKAVFINDVKSTLNHVIGFVPTVTFLPQDLELFSGAPAERRRFLDQLLGQVSPEYFTQLSYCQKILQQRNALLKRIHAGQEHASTLDLWDREFASRAAFVTLGRLQLIGTLNLSFREELASLGERWDNVELRYERKSSATDVTELEEEIVALLRDNRERDIILQSTSVGPHREDWQAYRDGRAVPSFASRGQERVCVLALLLLEVSYLELKRGEKPVILLDDAFSELDDPHQEALIRGFAGYQTLMTATREPPNADRPAVFSVSHGRIEQPEVAGLRPADAALAR